MKSAIRIGLVIGILCAIWQLVMVIAGWLTHPSTFALFYLVVLIEIAVLVWGLKQSAPDNGYGGQFAIGAGASVMAGIFLFLFSILLTTVLFPNLIEEMKAMQEQALRNAGRPQEQISAALALQTPLIQAIQGMIGTVVTGLIATAIIAAFLRRKPSVSA